MQHVFIPGRHIPAFCEILLASQRYTQGVLWLSCLETVSALILNAGREQPLFRNEKCSFNAAWRAGQLQDHSSWPVWEVYTLFSSLFTFTFTHCLVGLGHHIFCIAEFVSNHSQGVIDVSVKSTIKRSLHEWKYKRFKVQTMGYTWFGTI